MFESQARPYGDSTQIGKSLSVSLLLPQPITERFHTALWDWYLQIAAFREGVVVTAQAQLQGFQPIVFLQVVAGEDKQLGEVFAVETQIFDDGGEQRETALIHRVHLSAVLNQHLRHATLSVAATQSKHVFQL